MPWQELIIRTGISLVVFTATAWLYVHALLFVGRNLKGTGKVAVSMGIYVVVAAAIGGALVYVLGSAADVATRQSAPYIASVVLLLGRHRLSRTHVSARAFSGTSGARLLSAPVGRLPCNLTGQSTRTHNSRRRLRRKCWWSGHFYVKAHKMKVSYLRFLFSLVIAAIPASAVYTLLGYHLMPDVSSRGGLTVFLFVFFYILVSLAALVLGSVLYFLVLRGGVTLARFLSFPFGLAALWVAGASLVGRPVLSALPFAACLVVLSVTSYATLGKV